MDENTKKIIKEKFDSLPESIKEIILSSHYEESLIGIGRKYNLNVEQMGTLEKETTMVMMGLIPTKDFEGELTRELNVEKERGTKIVIDINEKIFLRIRELLKIMNSEEELSEEEITKANNEIEEKKILSSAGIEILPARNASGLASAGGNGNEKMPLLVPEKLELSAETKSHPIMADKLAGPVQTQSVTTTHSVDNLTKTPEPNKQPDSAKYTIDPYREPPQ